MSKTIDKSQMFYIDNVLSSLQVVDQHKPECDVRLSGNTLLLTRYEYCNLYHTMTDWFNAFLAMPSKTNIILLDAHAHGKLDPVWTTLWGNVTYIRQWEGKRVCLEEATLVPPGYASVLWRRGRSRLAKGVCPSMVDAFVKFFVQGHGLGDIQMEQGKVVIVDRIPYLAHPRSKPSSAERVVKNFDQVAAVLNNMTEVTSVQIVHFENRTFREQLAVIRSAHILMGNHGAGLAHLIFMQDDSALMEFEQPASGMMADFSRWKTKIQHIFLPQVERGKVSYQTIHESIVPQVRAVLLGKSWS
jgi:glycoprotein 2-beta-D-xylosyltransferase